jgi:hypothetical protein
MKMNSSATFSRRRVILGFTAMQPQTRRLRSLPTSWFYSSHSPSVLRVCREYVGAIRRSSVLLSTALQSCDRGRERTRHHVGLETLVPLLTAVPVVNIFANLIFGETVSLLNLAFELFPTAIYNVKVVVCELPPLLLDLALNLLPISFHTIPGRNTAL